LKPALVWKYFGEISRIPRPSKHEEQMTAYVLATAKKFGLEAKSDAAGNVVVRKPASKGRERSPMIALQGHLDMVCEKNAGTKHDFMKDPLELVRKGNLITANGTTLGADNGIAVATNLAIMEDRSLEHGPLEFLFTVDEETGLTGANNLQPGFVKSKTLLNLDSEEEGAVYVGCSGGRDTLARWKVQTEAAPAGSVAVRISVKGLKGGHSGLEIEKNRGNAIKILNRVLLKLPEGARLASINGGNKRNAIPREAEAMLTIPKKQMRDLTKVVSRMHTVIRAECGSVEPGLAIGVRQVPGAKLKVLKKQIQERLMATISALPHGVLKMSADIAGLVETSTNVAVLTTDAKEIFLGTSQRSSVSSELEEAQDTVAAIMAMGAAAVERTDGYPGWKPNLESPILKLARATYKELYGKEPEVKAIHAGLECGIIGEKYPGMDMISFGPTMEGVHSPDERLHIDTVEKFYAYLLRILKKAS
jgi:dipeptidase D